jgi:hypothetical protein
MAGGCSNSLAALDPSCAALKKKGGFDKRFYVGSIADLTAVTITSGIQEVTAFTFAATTGFKKIIGKRLKHGASTTLEAGEVVNMRVQNFNAVLYAQSALERQAIEELADAEDIFIVAESNSGTFEVFGINNGSNGQFDNFGMKATAGEWKHGVLLNDDTSVSMTFSGEFDNAAMIFDESETIAANETVLDALVV